MSPFASCSYFIAEENALSIIIPEMKDAMADLNLWTDNDFKTCSKPTLGSGSPVPHHSNGRKQSAKEKLIKLFAITTLFKKRNISLSAKQIDLALLDI